MLDQYKLDNAYLMSQLQQSSESVSLFTCACTFSLLVIVISCDY